jgi:hypothetical protein
MSESTSSGSGGHHGNTLDYRGPGTRGGTSLAKVGGALAVAGTMIGFAIFIGACAGYGAAFALSPIPLILGSVGLVLTLIGGFFSEDIGMDDPQVVACYVVNIAVIAGALLEMAFWKNWMIFAH